MTRPAKREKAAYQRRLLAVVFIGTALVGVLTISLQESMSPEDRAFWDTNGKKVQAGWHQGHRAGKVLAQSRAVNGKVSISSRDLATLAESERRATGLDDEVIGQSFRRGFVFGFYKGMERPEEPKD